MQILGLPRQKLRHVCQQSQQKVRLYYHTTLQYRYRHHGMLRVLPSNSTLSRVLTGSCYMGSGRCQEDDNFNECYADNQALKSKCDMDIFVQLISMTTGKLVTTHSGIEVQVG